MTEKKSFKDYLFLVISVLLVTANMTMIFMFSSQDGKKSTHTSGRVSRFILNIVVSDFNDMSESEQTALIKSTQHIIRKTAHFTEYAMLGFFAVLHIKAVENFKRKSIKFNYPIPFVFGVLYAVGDEIHQSFTADRCPAVKDVLIDSFGVLTGTVFAVLVFLLVGLYIKKKKGD